MNEFADAMRSAGISPPENIIADGTLHRLHVDGDKPKTTNSWYVLHDNPLAGAFGNWKSGTLETWSSKEHRTLTPEEKAQYRANMEAQKRQREQEQLKIHAECQEKSEAILKQAKPALENHPYLLEKQVKPHGLKIYKGSLVVPVRDSRGTLHGLQFIAAKKDEVGRNKYFKTGTNKRSHYFSIGGKPESVLYLAEGYATAATIHELTGEPIAVCFDSGNLKPVAKVLRAKFKGLKIVICADNDSSTDGNPGLTKARDAAEAIGGLLAVPEFPKGVAGSDFNDLAAAVGLNEVSRQIETAALTKNEEPPRLKVIDVEAFLQHKFPPRENILAPWLPAQGLAMVYAPRGIGKTHFSLGVAYAVASGGTFLQWTAEKPRGVLFIDGEMPGNVLQERISAIAVSNDKEPTSPLKIITPDLQTEGMLNLSDAADQRLVTPYLEGIDLIIVDNLSTLCRSGKEAEGESWLPVQQWALQQRAAGRSVLFIHHAGKNGEQRGTSRREDVLDTVISLKRPGDYTPDKGACFEIHFEKARGLYGDDTKPVEVMLTTGQDQTQTWAIKELEQSTAEKVAALLKDGVPQGEIAEMIGLTKGAVSKAKRRAQEDGLLGVS
jgi:putative DNA primase/helicase